MDVRLLHAFARCVSERVPSYSSVLVRRVSPCISYRLLGASRRGKSGIGPDPLAEGFGASAGVWLLASGDRLHRAGFLRGQKRCAAHAVCLSGKSRRASSDYCGAGAACEAAIRCCVENGGLVDGVGLFDRDHVAPRLCQRIGGGGCRSASWCDLPDCGVSRCSCFDASLRSVGGIKRGGRAFACAVKCADAPFCLMWDASAAHVGADDGTFFARYRCHIPHVGLCANGRFFEGSRRSRGGARGACRFRSCRSLRA